MAQMGIGALGNNDVIFKRKFRWTFEIRGTCGGDLSPNFVKLAARPNLTIQETEINFLHAKWFIPGKATWETITVTYYDTNQLDTQKLFAWLTSIYDFTNRANMFMNSKPNKYSGTGILILYDGCGTPMEKWTLHQIWPTAINFQELDYSSSDEVTIELTLRYQTVDYQSLCPPGPQVCTCDPCQ